VPAQLWIVRHGPTEWSRDGRHTSVTDLPLLPEGEEDARALAPRLVDLDPELVLSSPRRRARDTAALAGFTDVEVTEDLAEWAYGDYEGVSTPDIREHDPGWTVWTHETPGGESAAEVGERLDRVVRRVEALEGPVLAFGHGHALRVLAARWLGLPVAEGARFVLDTATVSVLGHEREQRAVVRWNS